MTTLTVRLQYTCTSLKVCQRSRSKTHLENSLFLPEEVAFDDVGEFWRGVLELTEHGILDVIVTHIWNVSKKKKIVFHNG